jgi:hypothetical protein
LKQKSQPHKTDIPSFFCCLLVVFCRLGFDVADDVTSIQIPEMSNMLDFSDRDKRAAPEVIKN